MTTNLSDLRKSYLSSPRDQKVIKDYLTALKEAQEWPFSDAGQVSQVDLVVSQFGLVAEMKIWGVNRYDIVCKLLTLDRKEVARTEEIARAFKPLSKENGFWAQRLPHQKIRILNCWGEPITDSDFFMVSLFKNGQAQVGQGTTRANTKFNVIDETGLLLLPEWVNEMPTLPV